jgi:hypothetical protein
MTIINSLKFSLRTFTFLTIISNIFLDSPFLRYYLFILIIYGTVVDLRSREKISKYYNINTNLLLIIHLISHYLIPFIFIYKYKFYNISLSRQQYIYGILFGYLYYILIDIRYIYFINTNRFQIEILILWTIIYILSNLI